MCLPYAVDTLGADGPTSLTEHIRDTSDLGDIRDVRAEWTAGVLRVSTAAAERHAWVTIPAPSTGWDLARRETVNAEIVNSGTASVGVMLWVVGDHGWDAVLDVATLAPGETRGFACPLRATFPDGTPKLNPGDVKAVQVMLAEPRTRPPDEERPGQPQAYLHPQIRQPVSILVRSLVARGSAPEWKRPPGRIDVPAVEDADPAPGIRVRYRLPDDEQLGIHAVLQLPHDWRPGRRFPVIVEFPGNLFFGPACYSTGRPEQCVISYGMTKGLGAICLGVPFVDRDTGAIAEHGWGDPDDTAAYTQRLVDDVCEKFGGDRDNLVVTGFSRGAIACGFIGLRDDRIAALWKGIHACQHYDGDGWNGATLPEALERAARFKGRAVFHTDNSPETLQPVMDAMRVPVTWASSGLGFHATAMFLDERPSSQQVRKWFRELVGCR